MYRSGNSTCVCDVMPFICEAYYSNYSSHTRLFYQYCIFYCLRPRYITGLAKNIMFLQRYFFRMKNSLHSGYCRTLLQGRRAEGVVYSGVQTFSCKRWVIDQVSLVSQRAPCWPMIKIYHALVAQKLNVSMFFFLTDY